MSENQVIASFSARLSDKLDAVKNALPNNFNQERFVQNCVAVLNDNPGLEKINKSQLIQGLIKGAYLSLDFMAKEAYLIPYGNTVQFQTSYKGEKKFVKNYSIRPIQEIYAKCVRGGDFFEEKIIDGRPSIDFKPMPFNGNEIIGAFAVVLYKDGGMEYEVMTTKDINGVRNNYSKAANSKAWKNSWDEMAKKTVLRRLCKHIETDFESIEARKAWEEASDSNIVKAEKSDEIVDVFAEDVVIDVDFHEVEDEISDMPDVDVFK